MSGTLSQTSIPTAQRAPRRAAVRFPSTALAVIGALALLGPVACYDPPDRSTDAPRVEKIEAHVSSQDFEWPTDPSHPVVELTVEGAGIAGQILIELMPELAPSSVVAVAELASDGYYDGTTFHRVIPGFMIQGGDPNSRDRDPTNDGTGRPGRSLPDEFSDAPFLRGVVGMGNKGRINSASTQFFIMQSDKQNLDGRYNAIGRVIQGMDVIDRIAAVSTDLTGRWGPKDRPIENIVITQARPVGQVAAIRQALELEATSGADAATVAGHEATGGLEIASGRRDPGVVAEGDGSNSDVPASPASGSGSGGEAL